MSGKAARVVITERQQAILQQLSSSTTVPIDCDSGRTLSYSRLNSGSIAILLRSFRWEPIRWERGDDGGSRSLNDSR